MEEDYNQDLVERFEEALEKGKMIFFDSEEFDEIITFYLDIYDLEYAEKAIHEAFVQHPNNIDLKIRNLEFLLANNRLKTAWEIIEELRELQLENLDFMLCQGQYWSLRKFHKKAISFYKEALKFNEDEDFIYNCIGNEYFELKNYEKCIESFKKTLDYFIDDEFAFFSIIDCYLLLHQHKECAEFIKEYIDKNPYSDTAWYALGQHHLEQKKYWEAIYAFDYVTVINQKSVYGYIQKAECYEHLEKWELAIATYKESLEYDDTPAFTHYKIGNCYTKLGKVIRALKAYVKSIHIDPQFDKSWFEIAQFYENVGNFEEAYFFIKEALLIDYENTLYIKKAAYYEVHLGKLEEAVERFRELVQIEPNSYLNWIAYSEMLITLGEYEEAITINLNTLKSFEKGELHYQLAACYFYIHQNEKGELHLNLATSMQPELLDEESEKFPILKRFL